MIPDGEYILKLLGLAHDHPDVRRSLLDLNIGRAPSLWFEDEDDDGTLQTQDFVANRGLGVDFGFEDQASFYGAHPDEFGDGPMILTQIYFYGEHPDTRVFPGRLPHDLLWSDDRNSVREKMHLWDTTRRSYRRDVWELEGYRMVASYVEDGARLGFLLFLLRPPAMTASREDAERLPPAATILLSLGKSIGDPELQSALHPLGFERIMEELEDGFSADFRDQFGLELFFGHDGGRADLCLTRAAFHREDAANNPRWPTALPHNLHFDLSPDELVDVIGPPEGQSDTDFAGIAIWRFPTHSCVVQYNTVENFLTSVEIAAIGVRE